METPLCVKQAQVTFSIEDTRWSRSSTPPDGGSTFIRDKEGYIRTQLCLSTDERGSVRESPSNCRLPAL